MKYLMGVDEGTTGCKAVLFDEEGRQISDRAIGSGAGQTGTQLMER
ncbi:MAG: hypothetical protein IKQ95_05610 [Synergistaceae bacterium]|nr:hypothetical protein [Synergistaceae bacterium]